MRRVVRVVDGEREPQPREPTDQIAQIDIRGSTRPVEFTHVSSGLQDARIERNVKDRSTWPISDEGIHSMETKEKEMATSLRSATAIA